MKFYIALCASLLIACPVIAAQGKPDPKSYATEYRAPKNPKKKQVEEVQVVRKEITDDDVSSSSNARFPALKDHFYADWRVSVGGTSFKISEYEIDEVKPHLGFDVTLGWKFSPRIRSEINIVARMTDDGDEDYKIVDGEYNGKLRASTASIFGTFIVDVMPGQIFNPYVGIGLGLSNVQYDFEGTINNDDSTYVKQSVDNTGFAGQLTFGVSTQLNERFYLHGGVHLTAFEDFKVKGIEFETGSTDAFIGIRGIY